ncbi:uncharacterized protein BX663DRAFT_552560 [Cokeromyces recurvatus]|uniref:uncharacterized protein n=1 Tax=Cokeromyces recurvatus TaxID=90255 RepID=UPI00221F82B4|nr:uncharacterized protein BX663DRAFT_552560 [Cokeromyces recurvatus]KAI7902136.1 hypothetical protein BX663DRAFT_552560 [Cokeromyces recurvatus]
MSYKLKSNNIKQAAAARFFQKPSSTQGFNYIYIPTKARIPVGKLRTTLRRLGIPNVRLLDIHYPARNLVAILVHMDYVSEFKSTLQQRGVTVDEDFDPFNGKTIMDPKYKDHTDFQCDQIASFIHKRRLETALQHIREPVKFAVARYFFQQHWISKAVFDQTMASRSSRPTDIFISGISQPTQQRASYTFDFGYEDNLIAPSGLPQDKNTWMTEI